MSVFILICAQSDIVLRSMLQTTRGDVFTRSARSFTTLARSHTPVLILWGKEDHTVPFAKSDSVRAAFPAAEFHAIDSAAHLPHIEQAALVDSILVRFLRGARANHAMLDRVDR